VTIVAVGALLVTSRMMVALPTAPPLSVAVAETTRWPGVAKTCPICAPVPIWPSV
jgi:hypothetical protein